MKSVFDGSPVRAAGAAIDALLARRRAALAGEGAGGFHESSFDLRNGLEISEQPLAELPDDLKHHFPHPTRR